MKIWKRLTLLCLALLMVATSGLLFGCNKKDYNKIELNEVTHSIFYAPLYVAINNGYFEDEGLTVSLTNGGGSNTSMSALLSGSADMILAGPETAVYTNQQGVSNAQVGKVDFFAFLELIVKIFRIRSDDFDNRAKLKQIDVSHDRHSAHPKIPTQALKVHF